MVNPVAIMKLMNAKNSFTKNHPKFVSFLQRILTLGLAEGDVIEITVTKGDGTAITSNMRITQSDLELMEDLKVLAKNQG